MPTDLLNCDPWWSVPVTALSFSLFWNALNLFSKSKISPIFKLDTNFKLVTIRFLFQIAFNFWLHWNIWVKSTGFYVGQKKSFNFLMKSFAIRRTMDQLNDCNGHKPWSVVIIVTLKYLWLNDSERVRWPIECDCNAMQSTIRFYDVHFYRAAFSIDICVFWLPKMILMWILLVGNLCLSKAININVRIEERKEKWEKQKLLSRTTLGDVIVLEIGLENCCIWFLMS